jgi:membrane protein required for colicin V production
VNYFDAFVTLVAIAAIALGFVSGLLRSLATIVGYLIAAPIAVGIGARLTEIFLGQSKLSPDQIWFGLCVVFIAVGFSISAVMRFVIGEIFGADVSLIDRIAGAVLGAVRIFFVLVLIVVVFDHVIPSYNQPEFLIGSRLRPYLSAAGRHGLDSLPPGVESYIDRLKRERDI